ncbi:Histidine kinase [Pelomyxa schiedti]|nr:Histidine kinase [Pelomyxa schiedti]
MDGRWYGQAGNVAKVVVATVWVGLFATHILKAWVRRKEDREQHTKLILEKRDSKRVVTEIRRLILSQPIITSPTDPDATDSLCNLSNSASMDDSPDSTWELQDELSKDAELINFSSYYSAPSQLHTHPCASYQQGSYQQVAYQQLAHPQPAYPQPPFPLSPLPPVTTTSVGTVTASALHTTIPTFMQAPLTHSTTTSSPLSPRLTTAPLPHALTPSALPPPTTTITTTPLTAPTSSVSTMPSAPAKPDLSLYSRFGVYYNNHYYDTAPNEDASASLQRDHDDTSDEDDLFFHESESEKLAHMGDWNYRFQKCIEQMRSFQANSPHQVNIPVNRELINLAQDFLYTSTTFGKIIIAERYISEERKTIKPVKLGGIAGGEKYIVHNILFKFAMDHKGLYGSDEAAAKAGGHELKGVTAYFNSGIRGLCLPLMALVDYRGFRLIAMSMLPISKDTISYGSNDYGRTIHADNKHLNLLVRNAAKQMNIKGHACGTKEYPQFLWSPADLEGHIGSDGRFYLLDFARVMPPEAPKEGIKNAHLFRLLRPEFVKSFHTPLCSDAFSSFVQHHKHQKHNTEIVEATVFLKEVVIPRFAEELSMSVSQFLSSGQSLYQFRLTEAMHRRGINMRFTDLVRMHATGTDCKTLLFVEMVARVIKNNIRAKLRQVMERLKLPLEEPYRRVIVDYMNLVLGSSEESAEFWHPPPKTESLRKFELWHIPLKTELLRKFEFALTREEEDQDLRTLLSNFSSVWMDGKVLLFQRIQKMTGLKFTKRVNEEFEQHPNQWLLRGDSPMDISDLEEIGQHVKHMNIISYAQGYLFKHQGSLLFATDPLAAQRFFSMSMAKFEESLDTDPSNAATLCNYGDVLSLSIEGEAKHLSSIRYTLSNPKVQQARSYYKRAIKLKPNDSHFLFRYAQFYEKCDKPLRAEQLYLKSLKANPNNFACLQEYGNFLTEQGEPDVAELFFKRCSMCSSEATPAAPTSSTTNTPTPSSLTEAPEDITTTTTTTSTTNSEDYVPLDKEKEKEEKETTKDEEPEGGPQQS